ncbi:36066_t:CDS:2, partial [Gigaspora margarita]
SSTNTAEGSSTNMAGGSSTNTKEGSSDNTNKMEEINLISDDECQINENEYGDDNDYASENSSLDISNDEDGYYN